jgi:hypothetical protein
LNHLSWLSLRVGRAEAREFGRRTVRKGSCQGADLLTTESIKSSGCRRQLRSSSLHV